MTDYTIGIDPDIKRSGKREGAGRKKVNVKAVSIKVPQDVADILASVEHPTQWICDAMRLKSRLDKEASRQRGAFFC